MDDEEVPEGVRWPLEDIAAHVQSVHDAQETMRSIAPYLDQVQRTAQLVSSLKPVVQAVMAQADHLSRVVEMVQSASPLVDLIQQNMDLIQRNLLAVQLPSSADQVMVATAAGLAQLSGPRRHAASASLVVTPTFDARPQRTAQASLTVTPTFAAVAEVATVQERVTVEIEQEEAPADTISQLHLVGLAVLLVYVWALSMPAAQELLPQEARDYLNGLWSTLGIALTIHLAVNANRKR